MSPDDAEKKSAADVLRRVLGGGALYGLATFLPRGLGLLLLPVFTRYLTPAEYGRIAVAETIAGIVAAIVGLGVPAAVTRLYYEHTEDPERQRSLFSTQLGFVVLVCAAAFGLLALAGPTALHWAAPDFEVEVFPDLTLALVTGLSALVFQCCLNLHQARQNPRTFASLSLAQSGIAYASSLALVVGVGAGSAGMLGGKAMGQVVALLAALVTLRGWVNAPRDRRLLTQSLRFGAPLVPHFLIALALVGADRIIIERFRPAAEVGVYSAGYTLASVLTVLTTAVMLAWSPIFYRLAKQQAQKARIAGVSAVLALGLSGAACFGIGLSLPVVPLVVGEEYAGTASVMPILLAGLLLHGYFSIFQLGILQRKASWVVPLTTFLAAALNIVLNIVWVPEHGPAGAAWATLAAYLAEAFAVYWVAQRLFRLPFRASILALGVLAAGASLVAVVYRAVLPPHAAVVIPMLLGGLTWLVAGLRARRMIRRAHVTEEPAHGEGS